MGMDVHGKEPKSKTGEYFRNNVWWWRPLWEYCQQVAPHLTVKVKNAQYNDGDGLNNKDSQDLAIILFDQIGNGNTKKYEKNRDQELEQLPLIICDLCEGTGKRQDPPASGAGTYPCNGCDSKGLRKNRLTHYGFSVSNVKDFASFLKDCGGFKIW